MQNNLDIFLLIKLYDIKVHYKMSLVIKINFFCLHIGQC